MGHDDDVEEELCWCDACRRTNMPEEIKFQWVGTCSCNGQDYTCFTKSDNWTLKCPECGCECSAQSAPSIEGTGYGHTTWSCNWLPCGWWYG